MPTTEDLEIAVQTAYSRLYPAGASSVARNSLEAAAEYSDAIYIASSCISKTEMSSQGFRDFASDALRTRSLSAIAKEMINNIVISGEDRVAQGLPAAERDCERPYFYPVTGAEARLASDLVQGAVTNSITASAREGFSRSLNSRPAEWFALADDVDRPLLLPWLSDVTGLSGNQLEPEPKKFFNEFFPRSSPTPE